MDLLADPFVFGQLIGALSAFAAGVGAYYSLTSRLSILASSVDSVLCRLAYLEKEIDKQTSILIELAATKERLTAAEHRIDYFHPDVHNE